MATFVIKGSFGGLNFVRITSMSDIFFSVYV